MEITEIHQFLNYYSKIKNRTRKLFEYIPEDQIEWTYKSGKFTIGDIIRHLATIERCMYAENVQGRPSLYSGCGIEFADGYKPVIKLYNDLHQQSMKIFSELNPESLNSKCQTPGGVEITIWKWLRAMVEHEVHHRGQLYVYIGMLGISTPPIYGLTSEEVIKNSN
jgi:uncharacterized damage-inducible protein DinB